MLPAVFPVLIVEAPFIKPAHASNVMSAPPPWPAPLSPAPPAAVIVALSRNTPLERPGYKLSPPRMILPAAAPIALLPATALPPLVSICVTVRTWSLPIPLSEYCPAVSTTAPPCPPSMPRVSMLPCRSTEPKEEMSTAPESVPAVAAVVVIDLPCANSTSPTVTTNETSPVPPNKPNPNGSLARALLVLPARVRVLACKSMLPDEVTFNWPAVSVRSPKRLKELTSLVIRSPFC